MEKLQKVVEEVGYRNLTNIIILSKKSKASLATAKKLEIMTTMWASLHKMSTAVLTK